MNLNLTSAMDYVIAISGMIIIIGSFAWNIYDVFGRRHSDSAMR